MHNYLQRNKKNRRKHTLHEQAKISCCTRNQEQDASCEQYQKKKEHKKTMHT